MTAIEASSVRVSTLADGQLFNRLVLRVELEGECWLWNGCLTTNGYGAIQLGGMKVGTHRAMWLAVHGSLPDGMYVCHRCDIRACINPEHLFCGTARDNAVDRAEKGRSFRPQGQLNAMSKVSDEVRIDVAAAYMAGETAALLARKHGVCEASVRSWARACGSKKGASGDSNGNAKLTREQVSGIRERLSAGASIASLARVFGVSWPTIKRIADGTGWAQCR